MGSLWKKSALAFTVVMLICVNFAPFTSGQVGEVEYNDQVAVLVYHHIDDNSKGPVTITTALFQRQLKNLLKHGYHFITLEQFRAFMTQGAAIPENAVLVTFDDGYESFYTNAYPILKKLRIPAVNFVISKDLEDPEATAIPSLSREEIAEMRLEDPDIEFQAHSDHLHEMKDGKPLLTYKVKLTDTVETEQQYEFRIGSDTRTCLEKMEPLNRTAVDAYAYPFGSYSDQAVYVLRQTGIRYGFTTTSGMTTRGTDPMQIPRINAGSPFVLGNSVNNLIQQSLHGKKNKQRANSSVQ